MFSDQNWARVLSGEEEGAFGWLAANFILGTIPAPHTAAKAGGWPQPVGALDMGGASTQITFHPKTEEILANLCVDGCGDECVCVLLHGAS